MARIKLILIALLTVSFGQARLSAGSPVVHGDSLYRAVPDLNFARLDRNTIVLPADSAALEPFFLKLDTLLSAGSRSLNIVHVGGSHVQAGVLTSRLRENISTMGSGLAGSPGLVFPFTAAKTNTPVTYRSRYGGEWSNAKCTQRAPDTRLGMTGMSVTTSDPDAYLRLLSRDRRTCPDSSFDSDYLFDRVCLFGHGSDSLCAPVLDLDGKMVMGLPDGSRSVWSFILPYRTDSVDVKFRGLRDGHSFTVEGLLLETDKPGLSVHAIGVNGASLVSYSRCDAFEHQLQYLNADLVIFGVGINDASGSRFDPEVFKTRYDSFISAFRRANPDCALLFITNNDSYRRVRRSYVNNPNGAVAEKAFLEIADKWGAGVWNLFDIMGGLKSMAAWEKAGLAKRDKIHFTNEGYELLGDLLFNAIMEKYEEHLRRCSSL